MLSDKIPSRQAWAWLLVSMSAPLAVAAGRSSWIWVLAVGVVCGGVCWGIYAMGTETPRYAKWFCCLQILWLTIAAGEMARWSGYCWGGDGEVPAVSVTLLVLAACASWNGGERASRVGSVLAWFVGLLYIIVLGAGVRGLRGQWIEATLETPPVELVFVFLIPVALGMLPQGKSGSGKWILWIPVAFGLMVSIWTMGTLSWTGMAQSTFPFYTFTKSLRLFGVAERFEAFVSVALTMGFFSVMSLFFSVAGELAEQIRPKGGRAGIVISCTLAAGAVLIGKGASELELAVLAAIFWGILPLGAAACGKIKKSKNNEKSA